MARPEAIAIAGYYPTPPHLVPWIARLIARGGSGQAILDPCAGDGSALMALTADLVGNQRTSVYAIEMEESRFRALERNLTSVPPSNLIHADAFRVQFALRSRFGSVYKGVSLLYLNPPYDHDREYGRLEERFLARFIGALCDGGVLVFVVPHYALSASAATLAKHCSKLSCFRFPAADFGAFKQVVLIGTRQPELFEPDPLVQAQVEKWASQPETVPELTGKEEPVASLPVFGDRENTGFGEWAEAELDTMNACAVARPWHVTERSGRSVPLSGILPDARVGELIHRTYPLAMPPRPAHIAAGIAAGIFNGARIAPDDPKSSLPPLLVKGVFNRENRTIEEKRNKDGDVTALVQVEQPKLVTTVLDLRSHRFITVAPSTDQTGATTVEEMTTADLLHHYGRSLMDVMLRQCPVKYDPQEPEHRFPLPEVARPLYRAQEHAVRAAVTLLGGPRCKPFDRRGRAAYLLGEIGSGKSSIALATMQALGARRTLILCPPHLLESWRDQAAAVVPWARVAVLESVSDVDAIAADSIPGPVVAVLSRETAKLGHRWASAHGQCPRCGAPTPASVDLAKQRYRCEHQRLIAKTPAAKLAQRLAVALLPVFPGDARVRQVLPSQHLHRVAERLEARKSRPAWVGRSILDATVDTLARLLPDGGELDDALTLLLVADPDEERITRVVRSLYEQSATDKTGYGRGASLRRLARKLLLFLPPNGPAQTALVEELKALGIDRSDYYASDTWRALERDVARAAGQEPPDCSTEVAPIEGRLCYQKRPLGTRDAILDALAIITKHASFRLSRPCGEPLFQAVPEPRRYPLASYIQKRHPRLFDFMVIDEMHEYSTDGSAQERSAHRLTGLGVPTLVMTGTVMNGYAESLFANMWALSPEFRLEFGRDDRQRFIDRYGYRKFLVQQVDKDRKPVAFGTVTDRVEKTERVIGNAPGVLPLFLLRHLLPMAATVQKADLALDLPPCIEKAESVAPSRELAREYAKLEAALVSAIKRDRFRAGLAGKLWGAMAELPGYLDRCMAGVGNNHEGAYEIRYPESANSALVAAAAPFDASTVQPKERWMLDRIDAELAEGRNVMVFGWHVNVLARLSDVIETHLRIKAPILMPEKVPTAKRQAWIDREIVRKKRRVLVVNPVAVQTGLNNLVWFATELWMQNPACNPVIYRQAVGRVHRIGQTAEARILFPFYANTAQEHLRELLLRKVAVSMSADGLDASSAIDAAGAGAESDIVGATVGRQLYEMILARGLAAA